MITVNTFEEIYLGANGPLGGHWLRCIRTSGNHVLIFDGERLICTLPSEDHMALAQWLVRRATEDG